MTDQAPELLPQIERMASAMYWDRVNPSKGSVCLSVAVARWEDLADEHRGGLQVWHCKSFWREAARSALATLTRPPSERPVAQMRETLEREENYLRAHLAADCGLMQGDIEGSFHRIRAALTAERPSEAAVAWRVRVRVGSMTCHAYTERLPFEPLEGSGTVVLGEPEPLYAIPHEEPGREMAARWLEQKAEAHAELGEEGSLQRSLARQHAETLCKLAKELRCCSPNHSPPHRGI